jgi:hypothetical protein
MKLFFSFWYLDFDTTAGSPTPRVAANEHMMAMMQSSRSQNVAAMGTFRGPVRTLKGSRSCTVGEGEEATNERTRRK